MAGLKGITPLILILALAAISLPAQVDYEPFAVVGSPIPGWTQHVGTWTVKDIGGGDKRAESTGTGHKYLTRTGSSAYTGAIEVKATGVSNTCNGGALFRWETGKSSGIRAYGASSGGLAAYKVLILDAPGVSRTLFVLTNRTKNLTARILAQGQEARAQFDVDPLDGKWDHELAITVLSTTGSPYGGYAWNGSYIDDIKFFDAVIFRRSTFGGSNIGHTIPLDLYAPTAGAQYMLLPTLLPGMIGLPNGWFSPIVPDHLTAAAPALPGIFDSFFGTLDGSGKATAKLVVPNIPALAGVAVYIAGVVLDGRVPPGFLHLFNDERIDLKT